MPDATKPILNLDDVPLREMTHGENFSAQLGRIGPLIGAKQLGCMLHVVPPGKKAFPYHAHHANEELLVILAGQGSYRMGEANYSVRSGDVIAAPAGDGSTAHQLINTGNSELRYLCISTRHDPEVVEYPDSGKFVVASMVPEDKGLIDARIAYVGRVENSLEYWDGEI